MIRFTIATTLCLAALMFATGAEAKEFKKLGFNVRMGPVFNVYDSDEGTYGAPLALLHLAIGHRPLKYLNFGVGADLDVVDNASDMHRVYGFVRGEYRVPLVKVFLGMGAGYWFKEIWGSDWQYVDDGFSGSVDLGFDMEFFKFFAVSAYGKYLFNRSHHDKTNSTSDKWVHNVMVGADFVVRF